MGFLSAVRHHILSWSSRESRGLFTLMPSRPPGSVITCALGFLPSGPCCVRNSRHGPYTDFHVDARAEPVEDRHQAIDSKPSEVSMTNT